MGHIGCGQGGQLALGSGHTGSGHTGFGHAGSGHAGALQIGALYTNLGQLQTGVGHAGGSHTHLKKIFFLFYYFSPPDFFKKTYCVGGQAGFGQTTAAVVALVQLHAGHSVLQVQLGQL